MEEPSDAHASNRIDKQLSKSVFRREASATGTGTDAGADSTGLTGGLAKYKAVKFLVS